MKNLIFMALILMGTAVTAQQDQVINSGVYDFETEVIYYGDIEQNSDGHQQFTFKNIGDSAIIIFDIKTSCGCTVVTKPEKPILPGETAEISVNYATQKLGFFSKTIIITSNASEQSKKLFIKGNVLKSASQQLTSSN